MIGNGRLVDFILYRSLSGAALARAALVALALAGCGTKSAKMPESGEKRFTGRTVINLFGLPDSERHLIERGTTEGALFLLSYDKTNDTYDWVDCPVQTQYRYQQHPMRTQEKEVRTTLQLAAELPMSQSQFQASIERGNWFRFHWAAVGSHEPGSFRLPRTNAECKRATHYVKILTVGAVTWSEFSATGGGVAVDTKAVSLGVKGSRGEQTADAMGDFSACFREAASGESGVDCRIPLQVAIAPLRDYQFCSAGDDACEASAGGHVTEARAPVAQGLSGDVPLYIGSAPASKYLAEALEKTFVRRKQSDLRGYGYLVGAPTLYGGIVRSGDTLETTFAVEAGVEYALLAAGDTDARDLDLSVYGAAIAAESNSGAESLLKFRANLSGDLTVVLKAASIGSDVGAFVGLMALRKGGSTRSDEEVRYPIRRALERGAMLSSEHDLPQFLRRDWAVYVLDMGKEVFKQPSVLLPQGTSVAFAVADDAATDIDIALLGEGVEEVDKDPDTVPTVRAKLDADVNGTLAVASQGDARTVVAAVILGKWEADSKASERTDCDPDGIGAIEVGTQITLGKHSDVGGDANWSAEMEPYVGKAAKVTELPGVDESGCRVARVDADGGKFAWRLRDAQVLAEDAMADGTTFKAGKWAVLRRGPSLFVWRADTKGQAAEFVDSSNGWWNWHSAGKAFTVWSSGDKEELTGTPGERPWQAGPAPKEKAERSDFTSGVQAVRVREDSLVVRTADGGEVFFQSNGTVQFRTFDGDLVTP